MAALPCTLLPGSVYTHTHRFSLVHTQKHTHTGSTELVSVLLDNGAIVTATDHHGSTPLHLACQKGHQRTVVRSQIHSGIYSDNEKNSW